MAKFRARKPRRGGPLPLRYVLLLTFVFFILSTVIGIWIVNKGLAPTLINYADSQNRKIAEEAVNYAKKQIQDEIDPENIVVTNKNNNYFITNPSISNKVEAKAQSIIQAVLNGREAGNIAAFSDLGIVHDSEGLVYSIPIGRATNNALLGNIGPKIPIKLQVIGDVQADLISNYKPVGINHISADVYIQLTVNVQTIIPFETKVTPYKQKITLFSGVIPWDPPQYYNGGSSTPTIQLPPKK
ncbi:sporulation protein YunB [Bacillus sp. FJAT-49736]|uniref:sporulation protein YunB n=1 Tax=Bacillus sp. FJAT-49736 TaxID=2833582 RepID=UPI001BC9C599|nr:sporulation protein YunB [Bacillus sp. FJAT-49736]MBS4173950.1 sporulation protein YunB [Bacillus sp. FJAT-49736]